LHISGLNCKVGLITLSITRRVVH